MRQTIKARYHDGVLQPLEPLALAEETEVQVTVDTTAAVSADEILRRATQVYQGLRRATRSQKSKPLLWIADSSSVSPQPDVSGSRSPRDGYPLRITQATSTGHTSDTCLFGRT